MLAIKEKCPYCHYDDAGLVKPLIKYAGAADLMGDFDYHEAGLNVKRKQLYIQGDVCQLGEFYFETNVNYCPKCGRKLAENEN